MNKVLMNKRLILVTSGEPGGIGPDICLDIPQSYNHMYIIVVVGDSNLLKRRADLLHKALTIKSISYDQLLSKDIGHNSYDELLVLHVTCPNHDTLGELKIENARYVLGVLDLAVALCQKQIADCIVTAPVSKENINQAGYLFSGHTEYLAAKFLCSKVVMMLSNLKMKVALVTTHLALKDVQRYITPSNLNQTIEILINAFTAYFGVNNPKIAVCGLNPHAGEGGFLGTEEIRIINPVINSWQLRGFNVTGSYSADTIFNHTGDFDVILAMYHDQGLPVLKYSGFNSGINVSLGLPVIRTSVDHGTALNLAGTGMADSSSLRHALVFAESMMGNTGCSY